jgi:hypothetical protein
LESTNPYTTAISIIQQNTTAATPVNLAIKGEFTDDPVGETIPMYMVQNTDPNV